MSFMCRFLCVMPVWVNAMSVFRQMPRRACIVWVFLFTSAPVLAQTVPVVFRVDMGYASVGTGDQVVLRGEGPVLGDWDGAAHPLERVRQTTIYRVRVAVPDSLVGHILQYKFVVHRSDGIDVWEEGANRQVEVPTQRTRLPVVFFSDVESAGLIQDQAVTFVVDAREALFYDEPPDGLALLGSRSPLGWALETDRIALADADADGFWEATVTFLEGTLPDIAFKLAYQVQGEWVWEKLPGHSDHVVLLDESASQSVYALRYDKATRRIVAATSDGLLDQYGALVQALGARGSRSVYRYYEAMQLLNQGNPLEARSAYDAYTSHWNEERQIDDFDYAWAHELAQNGDVGGALAYCEQRYEETVSAKRKAHFVYLSGEILLGQGMHDQADVFFNRVLTDYPHEKQLVDYSRQGMAVGRLQTNRTNEALPYLQALATTAENPRTKRQALKALARVYDAQADSVRLAAVEQLLIQEGTPTHRWQARFQKIKRKLKRMPSDAALAKLDQWLAQYPRPRAQAALLYTKVRYLKRMGQNAEAQAVQLILRQRYPKSRFAK